MPTVIGRVIEAAFKRWFSTTYYRLDQWQHGRMLAFMAEGEADSVRSLAMALDKQIALDVDKVRVATGGAFDSGLTETELIQLQQRIYGTNRANLLSALGHNKPDVVIYSRVNTWMELVHELQRKHDVGRIQLGNQFAHRPRVDAQLIMTTDGQLAFVAPNLYRSTSPTDSAVADYQVPGRTELVQALVMAYIRLKYIDLRHSLT